MTEASKDTIYIDVDDEITVIIDKLRASPKKIVALVLPKRAATLQSIVNMKLLKRGADEAKKNLVLITSEAGLLPLAGAVGLFVAKTLQSKPAVPPPPDKSDSAETVVEADEPDAEDELPLDRTKSIGELAGALALGGGEETIEVDADDGVAEAVEAKPATVKTKTKKNRKLKVPNFESFRLRLILGIAAAVILIVGWIMSSIVLPRAKITIKTDTNSIASNLSFNLSSSAKALDAGKLIVPATLQEIKKTDSEKVPATGQKDNGTKASGTMKITNCSGAVVSLPAGNGFNSGNFTFIGQSAISVPDSNYDHNGNCKNDGTATVNVVAQNGGDSYNLSARSYQIANGPASVSASGSDMTGGTSNVIKIVSGADIDAAKQKLKDRSTPAATDELKKALVGQTLRAVAETLTISDPTITSTPNVGDQSADVTVTQVVTYDMLGVKSDDLKTLVEADAKKQIDPAKQVILDNGLSKAIFQVVDRKSPGEIKLSVQAIVTAGPQLNADDIKRQIAGKKKGEAVGIIQNRPGIKDVNIDYSPFWVMKTPKRASHITVIFEKPPNNANK